MIANLNIICCCQIKFNINYNYHYNGYLENTWNFTILYWTEYSFLRCQKSGLFPSLPITDCNTAKHLSSCAHNKRTGNEQTFTLQVTIYPQQMGVDCFSNTMYLSKNSSHNGTVLPNILEHKVGTQQKIYQLHNQQSQHSNIQQLNINNKFLYSITTE